MGVQQKGWGISSKKWVTVANKEQWISHFPNFCYIHIMSTQCCVLFKNTSDVENITIDLKGFLKKLKLIIIKDDKYKHQQEQNYESLSIIK